MSKGCGWRDYPNDHGGWSRRSNKFGARLPTVARNGRAHSFGRVRFEGRADLRERGYLVAMTRSRPPASSSPLATRHPL